MIIVFQSVGSNLDWIRRGLSKAGKSPDGIHFVDSHVDLPEILGRRQSGDQVVLLSSGTIYMGSERTPWKIGDVLAGVLKELCSEMWIFIYSMTPPQPSGWIDGYIPRQDEAGYERAVAFIMAQPDRFPTLAALREALPFISDTPEE